MTILIDEKIIKVISFVTKMQRNFKPAIQRVPYYHMGATITDAVLQAGMNYKNVVYPRVCNILTNYKDYTTSCDFIILFQTIPLADIINWKNEIKQKLIFDLTWFFFNNDINNENQLSHWLYYENNVEQLLQIKGIGLKTVDYLKLLSGQQAIPIDRHMLQFLMLAGVNVKSYKEASEILIKVSQELEIKESILDNQIWTYMAEQ